MNVKRKDYEAWRGNLKIYRDWRMLSDYEKYLYNFENITMCVVHGTPLPSIGLPVNLLWIWWTILISEYESFNVESIPERERPHYAEVKYKILRYVGSAWRGKVLCIVEERKSNGIQFAEAEMNESETKLNDAHENRALCIYELC